MQHDKVGRPPGIHVQTIGDCWLESIRYVLNHGLPHLDGRVELLELLGLAVEISAPKEKDPLISAHGDPTVLSRTLAKFARGASMPERPFTYAQRIFDMNGVDQFDWMVERLQRKPDTKSATINLLVPGSTAASLPCLTTLDAKIRQGRLDLQFFFRSQNIFGRQYANLAALAQLQTDLARRCNTVSGVLRGYVASAHIYAFDIDDARKLTLGNPIRIADRYYELGPPLTGA
ncbi:hypothetical protein H5395_12250 [Paracoccus sp. MC1854]|uniref:thymidylate synthase n=1 Tax=Paracoccus sp. MC1854 TaxID=2760306 RepID=UPI0015FFAA3B|nr:thymidylate synthase [Paracoccus sp. MC1854]MBB1492293.1 hypothetical protein [Paracoccus sp. MC1854]